MTSTPQRLQGSERKRLIEDAASRLFAEQGYEGTSIEQIATAAGVTKPVVYLHFSSKQNLHLALLAKHRDELLGQLASDMRAPGALEYRIVDVATRWFAYVQSHPYAWQMLFKDTTGEPEIAAVHGQMRESARALVASLLYAEQDLAADPPDIELHAEIIRSAMTGLALWSLDHPELTPEALAAAVHRMVWTGLRARPRPRRRAATPGNSSKSPTPDTADGSGDPA
jgi:AcrR family transcriptional regulator